MKTPKEAKTPDERGPLLAERAQLRTERRALRKARAPALKRARVQLRLAQVTAELADQKVARLLARETQAAAKKETIKRAAVKKPAPPVDQGQGL